MRKLKTVSQLILLFITTLIASCTYEPVDGTVEPDPGIGIFQADFNGATWKSNRNEAIVSGNFIQIAASNSKGENFGIMIDGSTVGTYAANINIVSFSPAGTEYGYWGVNDDNPTEDTGSVIITSINTTTKTISGTFQFKGYWSDSDTPIAPIQFTNGVFKDIPYTTQEESADVFTAKVGGVNFVPTDIQAMVVADFITIGSLDANFNNLSIAIKNTLGAGTYAITNTMATNGIADEVQGYYEDINDEYKAVSGNITITSKTADKIKGTFQFTTNGATPFVITEGKFDVEY
ncbi:DUF6252 family protein [Flavobacterium seoulense]|uniref:Lipoprotein n=1 Tax=Flavobacterium seoulense TaxID=1492738 RepID=A0A066WII1_9FLAO|nr:DUF6252 family protein [Flavobacterium seoulense]KDN53812.1 hypothetical protein FEM21_29780 [Flavobacterium seoulense]